jgi:hypothetical protein
MQGAKAASRQHLVDRRVCRGGDHDKDESFQRALSSLMVPRTVNDLISDNGGDNEQTGNQEVA